MIYIQDVVRQIQVLKFGTQEILKVISLQKVLKHLAEALAPLSIPQISRLGKAARFGEDPETGKDLSFYR